MDYYNLYTLSSPKKDYLCKVPLHGYETAVKTGHIVAKSCNNVYVKSIPIEDWRAHDYQLRTESIYYDY